MKKQVKEKQYSPSSSGSSANGAVVSNNGVSVFSKLFSHIILILRRLFGFLGLYSYLKVHPSLGWRSSTFRQGRVFRVAAYTSSVLLFLLTVATIIPIYTKSNQAEATTGTATASTLTFTSIRGTASVNLNVSSRDGTFATSGANEAAAFSISTSNYTGYTLTLKSAGNIANTDLDNSGTTISTLSAATSAATFAANTDAGKALNNKWGIIPSYYNSVANATNYYPAPTKDGSIPIRTTSAANSDNGVDNADAYTIGIGLRADYTNPSGTYTNSVFILEYVANEIAYTITYSNGSISGVSGLPGSVSGNASNVMDKKGESGNTSTYETDLNTIGLSAVTPTRSGYGFVGWCHGTLGTNGTSCGGTPGVIYPAGANFGIDKTANNQVTLYAVWKAPTITFKANGGTGSDYTQEISGTTYLSGNDFTRSNYYFKGWSTASGDNNTVEYRAGQTMSIADDITLYAVWGSSTDTSLYNIVASLNYGRTLDNTTTNGTGLSAKAGIKASTITKDNSGVFTYNTTTFGALSDAKNSSNGYDTVYLYRGILDGTVGTYGSDGNSSNYPNYIILDADGTKTTADTCWRIVRTTGSGGVKMIYNGKWTGTTCANATTNAQVTTQAFGLKGNSKQSNWNKNINRVGYTFNNSSDIQDITTSTPVDTVFGSNSNYSTTNTENSNIKKYIENTWFSNISAYESILEASAGYCNDRTAYSNTNTSKALTEIPPYATSGATMYFGAYGRNMNSAKPPSLTCPASRNVVDLYTTSSASDGNKQLSKPVALITADEASFVGSGNSASNGSAYNANSFLRSGSEFRLLSPNDRYSNGFARGFYLTSNGNLGSYVVSGTNGVRPAISLKPGTTAASGSGTATDPWVVTAPSAPTLISFTIDDTGYQAEEGMTWGEWVDSSYGNEYSAYGTYIIPRNSSLRRVGGSVCDHVLATDTIIAGHAYITYDDGMCD